MTRRFKETFETDPLTCPKCEGEMRIISFINQPDVIKNILQHLGLWEEPESHPDPGVWLLYLYFLVKLLNRRNLTPASEVGSRAMFREFTKGATALR